MRSLEEIRQNLAVTVLRVRGGSATSRKGLADVMHLSPTTAGDYVDQLIEAGYLEESGLDHGSPGRPSRRLRPLPAAGWFAGIEFNAERLRTVAVDFSGQRAAGTFEPLPASTDSAQVMDLVLRQLEALRQQMSQPLLGIGFGSPGLVEPAHGVALQYAFMPGWRDVPVCRMLRDHTTVPVLLENNIRAIALAERWFGDARTLEDYVILGPRSGFGVAMVSRGRLMGGAHQAAGEVGCWVWKNRSGGTSRVHDHLTAPAVWRRLAKASAGSRLPANLHNALAKLGESQGEAWEELIQDFAQVLANLQLLLDTEVAFLHGPLTALGDRFCEAVSHEMISQAPLLQGRNFSLRLSRLDDEAGALGAACLAMENWLPTLP